MSVTEIADYVGYKNMSYFYKKFLEKYNCTPKEYKNKFQHTPD